MFYCVDPVSTTESICPYEVKDCYSSTAVLEISKAFGRIPANGPEITNPDDSVPSNSQSGLPESIHTIIKPQIFPKKIISNHVLLQNQTYRYYSVVYKDSLIKDCAEKFKIVCFIVFQKRISSASRALLPQCPLVPLGGSEWSLMVRFMPMAILTIEQTCCCLHNTMNVMKPGSQATMRHGVVKGHQTDAPNDVSECWSISFRTIVQVPSPEDAPLLSIEHQRDSPVTSKKTVVLVPGDSFAARLDAGLLGKGKQDVRNIAIGGRKIEQCQNDIETFIQQHPDVQVKKLFVSIGTNDIRNCKNGITHLKQPLSNLMKSIRLNLPDAKVWFQNLPPIHPNGCKFTVKNVLNMNKMIFYMF